MNKPILSVIARRAMRTEGLAILISANRAAVSEGLERAAQAILSHHPTRVVTTGLGKSGLVARKVAATFTATGQPALFLHPVDALHGDLGILDDHDVLLMVSRSGATPELFDLLDAVAHLNLRKIGIIGTPGSPLALRVDESIDTSVNNEADPLGLVPTASTAVAMAIGDALACALMAARGITAADLERLHPAGVGGAGK